jgi:hypothetical protein
MSASLTRAFDFTGIVSSFDRLSLDGVHDLDGPSFPLGSVEFINRPLGGVSVGELDKPEPARLAGGPRVLRALYAEERELLAAE